MARDYGRRTGGFIILFKLYLSEPRVKTPHWRSTLYVRWYYISLTLSGKSLLLLQISGSLTRVILSVTESTPNPQAQALCRKISNQDLLEINVTDLGWYPTDWLECNQLRRCLITTDILFKIFLTSPWGFYRVCSYYPSNITSEFQQAVLLEDVWDNTCQWAVGSVESQQLKPENQVCFPKTLTPHIAFIIFISIYCMPVVFYWFWVFGFPKTSHRPSDGLQTTSTNHQLGGTNKDLLMITWWVVLALDSTSINN